ncbi:hypothetical protein K443DRAFT_683226 [Laccaria amethystina LaAM-08-1]|uniref:Uncharacterized protein n=1 Tax=Laccaria amethystina LaAM-08-1 TaxID=1095629 RepID=A0A0C9WTD0_9AGAR|nr:hypothetical protein K443DRAFT_683226 [Laccaria amethystina LaAM-08-1]
MASAAPPPLFRCSAWKLAATIHSARPIFRKTQNCAIIVTLANGNCPSLFPLPHNRHSGQLNSRRGPNGMRTALGVHVPYVPFVLEWVRFGGMQVGFSASGNEDA